MRKTMTGWLGILGLVMTVGCGGGNYGEQSPGNPSGGVLLSNGSVAMHPQGRWVVTRHKEMLMVMDLQSNEQRKVRNVFNPDRLAFAPASIGDAVLVVAQPPFGAQDARELLLVDLIPGTIRWRVALPSSVMGVDTADLLENVIISHATGMELRRMATGELVDDVTLSRALFDLDVTPNGQHVVITERNSGTGTNVQTRVAVYSTVDASQECEVTIPNCSSELVLAASGTQGFIAPTGCGRDPVSVMDLDPDAAGGCRFRENLPGFGPVILSGTDHNTVVAFMDNTANDPNAPAMPDAVKNSASRYHLMFINAETLEYETVEWGQHLPRYASNPSGSHLLVDVVSSEPELTVVDLETKTKTLVAPIQLSLDRFSFATYADRAFIVKGGLFRLDVAAAHTEQLPLDFTPKSLNVTPDGTALVLTREAESTIYVYSVDQARVARTFDPELVAAN